MKYTEYELYEKHVGCSMYKVTDFLSYLNEKKISTVLRQVIIPSLNDNEENILKLKAIKEGHSCVEKTELLPFRKICQVKYDKLNMTFPFGHIPEPKKEVMEKLQALL